MAAGYSGWGSVYSDPASDWVGNYTSDVGLQLGSSSATSSTNDSRYHQRQALERQAEYARMLAMQQNVTNMWDFNRPATLTTTGVEYLDEPKMFEEKDILSRLRRETKEFIGDRKLKN